MFKRFTLFLLTMTLSAMLMLTVTAQEAPPGVVETAIRAAQDALGRTARPDSWAWERLPQASDTALGCPLATGTELEQPVTPYRVSIVYPDGTYFVHVSADSTIVRLCDETFGADQIGTDPSPVDPQTGCTVSALANSIAYSAANINTTQVAGWSQGDTATALGRSTDGSWLQIRLPETTTIAWVLRNDVTTSGACDNLPVTAAPDPAVSTTACFVTPVGEFANVRAQPQVESAQVSTIFENTVWQVRARNTEGTWYLINPGWVALTVVTPSGECGTLPVRDDAIGTGTVGDETTQPIVAPEGVQTGIPVDALCPDDFEGFMSARIATGAATAKIEDGEFPNAFRAYPSTDDSIGTRIGVIQPGRTLDNVLNGPACSEGIVWWLVEVDGVVGWTAESNIADEEYYIVPLITTDIPAVVPIAGDDIEATILDAEMSVRGLYFTEDGTQLVVQFVAETHLEIWDIALEQPTPTPITAPAPVSGVALLEDTVVTTDMSGAMRFWDLATLEQVRELTEVVEMPYGGPIEFSSDGALFATTGCNEQVPEGCTLGQVELWDALAGTPIRLQPAHPGQPLDVAFSSDDSILASVGNDGVQFWDVVTGAFLGAVATPDNFVTDVAFSPDGDFILLATCVEQVPDVDNLPVCVQGELIVWDLELEQAIFSQTDHTDYVQAVLYSPDGLRYATAGRDGAVFVYEAETNERLYSLIGPDEPFNTLAFSPDGALIAAGADDGTIWLWPLDVPEDTLAG